MHPKYGHIVPPARGNPGALLRLAAALLLAAVSMLMKVPPAQAAVTNCTWTWGGGGTSLTMNCSIYNDSGVNLIVWDSWILGDDDSNVEDGPIWDSGNIGSSRGGLAPGATQYCDAYTVSSLTPGATYYFDFRWRSSSGGSLTHYSFSAQYHPPSAGNVSSSGFANASQSGALSVSDSGNDIQSCSVISGPSHGSASCSASGASGSFSYTPSANWAGTDAFNYQVQDSGGMTSWATVTLNVNNRAPSAGNDSYSTNEDAPLNVSAPGVTANDSDPDGQPLTASVVTNVSHGSLSLNGDGSFTYTPSTNYSGSDSFTYRVYDGYEYSGAATVSLTVNASNDTPVFTKGADQTVDEDAGAQSIANWATGIGPGGGSDEAGQTLAFNVSNSNNALFSQQPAIATDGTLTYRPADEAYGSATVSVSLQDNGGTANGGDDTADTQTFTITVNEVNDEPSFTKGADQSVNEDAGLISRSNWATGISRGGGSPESSQTLTFHVSNTNTALFSQQPAVGSDGTLTYRPADNAHGSATVSVYLQDSGGTANGGDDTSPTQTFTITVSPVNDAPVLDTSGSPTVTAIDEDDTTNTGMLVSALLATGAGGDPISDVDDNAAEGTGVGIAVIGVNNDDGAWQYSTNGGGAWSAFGAASANAARLLVADADTRVRFVPDANWHGTVNSALSFRAWDQKPASGANGGTADIGAVGAGFETPFSAEYELATLTVNPINDAPILDNSGDMALDPILEDQTPNNGTSVVALIESAGGNRITEVVYEVAPVEGIAVISVDNTNGDWQFTTGAEWTDFGAPDESAARLLAATTATKVRFVPDSHWSMSWDDALTPTITFRAWDQTIGSNGSTGDVATSGGITAFSTITETVIITVTSLNDAPTFAKGADQVLDEDSPAQAIPAWATAILAGPTDEVAHGQTMHFNIVYNTAPELFSVAPSISPTGTLTYTPAPDAYGEATVIFDLQDNGGTVGGGVDSSPYGFFVVSLNGVNDPPAFTAGANQTVDEDTGTHTVDGWATAISRGPANEDWQDLDFILTVSNPGLFAAGPVISATGQLSYTLAANANGVTTIAVQLHDGGGTQFDGVNLSDVQTVTLTVNPLNDPPVNTALPQVSGLPFVNDTLTATTGSWNDDTDRAPGDLTYAYQWQRADDASGTNLTDIAAATGPTYTLTLADAGQYVRVRVTATDDGEGTPAAQSTGAFSAYTRIGAVNTDVTLSDFERSTVEDTPLAFTAGDFTDHFVHVHSEPMERIRITALPISGTLALDGAPVGFGQEITATLLGRLVYTPTAEWNGPDVFHWNATNDVVNAGYVIPGLAAAVTVTTGAVNDAPVITPPGAFSVNEDGVSDPKVFVVSDADTPFVEPPFAGYEFSLQAEHGVLALATTDNLTPVDGANGSAAMGYTGSLAAINAALNGVLYQPDAGYSGLDQIQIIVADHGCAGSGEPQADDQAIEVFVVGINNPPENTMPAGFMLEPATTSAALTFSVADDARAPIQFTLSAGSGVITLSTTTNLILLAGGNGTSSMTYRGMPARVNAALAATRYRPSNGYHGPVNLTLYTNDLGSTGAGGAQSDTDVMTITVNATPLAAGDRYTATATVPLIVPAPGVLANDTDADADALTAGLVTAPTSGEVSLSPDGGFVFTPTLDYGGSATFAYRAGEVFTSSLPATVTIHILKVVPTLDLVVGPATTLPGQAVTFSSAVTGTLGGAPPGGDVTFYANGATAAVGTLADGIASATTTGLGVGDYVITADYHGDLNYEPASAPLSLTVTITDTLSAGGLVSGGVVSGTITNDGTLADVTVYTGAVVSGGTISGTVINDGTLDGVTINPGAQVTGGTLTGDITNGGTLVDVTIFTGTVVSGGIISGTITNHGQVQDVDLGPAATVTGGTLGGEVNGTPGHPALLQQVTVAPGASLSHVTLGFGVVLPPDAVIGDGVLVLALVHTPDGRGTVTSTPAGIDGGPDCQHAFDYGLIVELTATPADTATAFDAWSGDCTGTEPTCSLTLTAARDVTATFKSGMKLFFPFVRYEYVDE